MRSWYAQCVVTGRVRSEVVCGWCARFEVRAMRDAECQEEERKEEDNTLINEQSLVRNGLVTRVESRAEGCELANCPMRCDAQQ